VKPTAAPSKHPLDRATEVDVDDIEPRLNQYQSAGRKLFWFGAHQLSTDGVLVFGKVKQALASLAPSFSDQGLVEHHLGERVGSAQLPRDPTHRPVAVARQSGLHNGKTDLHIAYLERT